MKKVTFLDNFLRSWLIFLKFCNFVLRNFSKFCKIIHTKFFEIFRNKFYFRINFVFREIEKVSFVSILFRSRSKKIK
jgi:hypothetical protein